MKLVNCKKCKGEIARNEQACPHCGEKRSSILKSETAIGIAIFVLSGIVIYYFVNVTNFSSFASGFDKQTASTGENHSPYKKMHELVTGSFYNCLSQNYSAKPGQLKLDEILACDEDFRKDSKTPHDLINLDNFVSNFSPKDNSYRPLEKAIKSNMFDVSSYQHVETTYRLALNQQQPYAIVQTVFKGKNVFERILKDSRAAKIDIKTGEIIALIPNVTVSDTGELIMEIMPE
ncbi:hypothetical protein [Xenorhabdus hominickii]|uniref:Membrane protein n=1 Tax=Xenorhabdus hominickii TaxID=351679 RepID=A0A2G0Q6B2_XENHO|nr:hypothetical protein [Xenorhabdus hominickii]AOM39469.1 hypothetical protein A9255_01940 [Xenorhabdus hominickii]PHM54765.1 membrane protein [Xenorhabdus hominickii]